MIATNAKKIVDLRANGYRPNEMILVSLVGKIDELNHTIFALPKAKYDWSWCANLDICVYADSSVDWMATVAAISEAKPNYLALWDVDRKEGAEFWRLPDPQILPQIKMKLFPNVWCSVQNKMFLGELCN